MKTEIITPHENSKRVDAFWYRDKDIARIQFPNGKKLYASACGEIKIQFKEDGIYYKNIQAVEMARDLELVDDDLDKIGLENDGWDMSNWFAVREFDMNGVCSHDDLGICHTYDEAITMLEAIAKENFKEHYS